jgi:xylose dehydrogenase (NAD/NADP)
LSAELGIGVIGSTSIVARLAVLPAIEAADGCRLAATASLSDPSATYPAYEVLLDDPQVDAVYIPLPNSLHREWTERAAAAGKHVLCEKPLAPSANDALAMQEACADAGVVLMEAYMTHFHPRDRQLRQLLGNGALGDALFGFAAFTGVLDRPDDHRWRPEMGGGALLDVGIYCLTPLLTAFGADPTEPDAVKDVMAEAHRAPLGVDASFSGWLDFGEGRSASFQCSFEAPERQLLELVGTEAALSVDHAFTPSHDDVEIRLTKRDGSLEMITSTGDNPYRLMVEHFRAVVAGSAELERTPAESVGLQRIVDRLAWTAEPAAT